MINYIFILCGIIFYLLLIVFCFLYLCYFAALCVLSFGAVKDDEDYMPFYEKAFLFFGLLISVFILFQIYPFVCENFYVLVNGLPDTIEVDGYTYQLEEYKPSETIERYGETYFLVTEQE